MSDAVYNAICQATPYLVQERRLPGARQDQTYTLVISLGKIQGEAAVEEGEGAEDNEIRFQYPVVSPEEATRKYKEFCLHETQYYYYVQHHGGGESQSPVLE